ncbi:hypothetical protein RhiirA4_461492 [Rhizophagus irregularis]|uniref:Uncharacterized protein n=1 Tax=Rhizophagus irregularis TaxID=588596 RepID=A0A2I1GIZ3_9GLOM|nr:hypothetical protein RhiirA4_461492 [Rhizophagus irregularis]
MDTKNGFVVSYTRCDNEEIKRQCCAKSIYIILLTFNIAENYEQKDKHNRLENSDTENFNFKMEEQKLALKERSL